MVEFRNKEKGKHTPVIYMLVFLVRQPLTRVIVATGLLVILFVEHSSLLGSVLTFAHFLALVTGDSRCTLTVVAR